MDNVETAMLVVFCSVGVFILYIGYGVYKEHTFSVKMPGIIVGTRPPHPKHSIWTIRLLWLGVIAICTGVFFQHVGEKEIKSSESYKMFIDSVSGEIAGSDGQISQDDEQQFLKYIGVKTSSNGELSFVRKNKLDEKDFTSIVKVGSKSVATVDRQTMEGYFFGRTVADESKAH